MYPNILVSILILLIALEIIGGMLPSRKLAKAAAVCMVLLVAAALILWLLAGLYPVPAWVTKFLSKVAHSVRPVKP